MRELGWEILVLHRLRIMHQHHSSLIGYRSGSRGFLLCVGSALPPRPTLSKTDKCPPRPSRDSCAAHAECSSCSTRHRDARLRLRSPPPRFCSKVPQIQCRESRVEGLKKSQMPSWRVPCCRTRRTSLLRCCFPCRSSCIFS